MSNYILKYLRDDNVKYISHLDFIRLFHRAVRRADLEMTFSQGFNPHPVMTVALPLSVGVTSDCEYMKIGFEQDYAEQYVVDTLNSSMPLGYKFTACRRLQAKEIDLTKIDSILYRVEIETDSSVDVESFMTNTVIEVMKKSKSGEKLSDIRPHIFEMNIVDNSNGILVIDMTLSAGCGYNLKPDTVIDAMKKYSDFECTFYAIHRCKAFCAGKEVL